MLRKFRIKINEKEYMVEMEELGTAPGPGPISAAPLAAPVPAAVPVQAEAAAPIAAPVPSGEGFTMEAPMPGSIISVQVKAGDQVKENQVLVVLEAMKMENEIVSPKDGIVTAVHVAKGSAIDVGAPIVTIA